MKATQDSVNHGFNVGIAKKYGDRAAIFLSDIIHWIQHNKDENFNCFDGRTWTYRTYNGFQKHFPYWSRRQIEHLIKKLISAGVLLSKKCEGSEQNLGCFYALVDEGMYIYSPQPDEGVAQICVTPTQICVTTPINKYNKQNNKKSSFSQKQKKEEKKSPGLEPSMPINYKCDMTEYCKYHNQEKEIYESGYHCKNEGREFVVAKTDSDVLYEIWMCPGDANNARFKKTFKYHGLILTIVDDPKSRLEPNNSAHADFVTVPKVRNN